MFVYLFVRRTNAQTPAMYVYIILYVLHISYTVLCSLYGTLLSRDTTRDCAQHTQHTTCRIVAAAVAVVPLAAQR